MFESQNGIPLLDDLAEVKAALEQEWPKMHADLHASGVPLNEVPEAAAAEPTDPAALAGGAGAGEVTDGQDGGDPLEPAAQPAAPELDPLELQAELEYMRQQQGDLLQVLEEFASARTTGQQPAQTAGGFDIGEITDEYGNLNPAALLGVMQQRDQGLLSAIGQMMQQVQAPLEAQAVAARQEHYSGLVEDIIADETARNGDLTPKAREFMESRAVQMLGELNQRYGTNADGSAKPRVLELAIARAAGEVRDLLGSAGNASVEQHMNRLGTLAGAHGEPGVTGAGIEAPVVKVGERSSDRYAAT